MKKILCLAIVFLSLSAIAQEKKSKKTITKERQKIEHTVESAEALAKSETKKLTKQLELTTDQQNDVYKIFLNHFEEELKIKRKIKEMVASNDKTDKEEMKKSVKKVRHGLKKRLDMKLKEILNAEQYESYQETNLKNEKIKQKAKRNKY